MKTFFSKNRIIEIYLFLMLLSLNITNLLVIPVGENRQLHIHHIITFLFIIWTILHYKEVNFENINIKRNMMVIYYLYALIISLILAFKYGVGGTVVNVIYCLILFVIISIWKDMISWEHLEKIIQYVGYIFAVSIVINLFFQWRDIIGSVQQKTTHLLISTIVAGGQNIEATFLASYACCLLYKKKYGFWMFSMFISLLYSSRMAILLNILSITLFLISQIKNIDIKNIDRHKKVYGILLAIIFIVSMGVIYGTGHFDHVIDRFLNIGKDNGSSVRIQMWTSALEVFKRNPFGVGIGNAIIYAEKINGKSFGLTNIHCVYLQVLVETGIIGFGLFLISVYQIIKKVAKEKFLNPLGAMTVGYLFCCILQFRGIEPLYIIVLLLFMTLDIPICNLVNGNVKSDDYSE